MKYTKYLCSNQDAGISQYFNLIVESVIGYVILITFKIIYIKIITFTDNTIMLLHYTGINKSLKFKIIKL